MRYDTKQNFIAGCATGIGVFSAALLAVLMPFGAAAQDQSRALTQAYNASGQELFKQLSARPGNIVFSPYSIGAAMAMALLGARGETETEIARVLHHRQDRDEIGRANADVLAKLDAYGGEEPPCPADMKWFDDECRASVPPSDECPSGTKRRAGWCVIKAVLERSAKLRVANALVVKLAGLDSEYGTGLEDYYAAEVFYEDNKAEDINDWVKKKTHGRIDKILGRLNWNDSAIVLSATALKAQWRNVFNVFKLRPKQDFSLTRSRKVKVPMMQGLRPYPMVTRDGYRAIRLPYWVTEIGLIIVLPDESNGIDQVSNRLRAEELVALFQHEEAKSKMLFLTMPRFKVSFGADFVEPFKKLGMRKAFDRSQADFSAMTGRPQSEFAFRIGGIVHRAVLDVTEAGTEAEATTDSNDWRSGGMSRRALGEAFYVNRPFLFYIVDDATGAILFQGRIVDPR